MIVYLSKFVLRPLRRLLHFMDPTMRTAAAAGADVVDLATNEAYPGERAYFTLLGKDDSSPESMNEEKQQKLWEKVQSGLILSGRTLLSKQHSSNRNNRSRLEINTHLISCLMHCLFKSYSRQTSYIRTRS